MSKVIALEGLKTELDATVRKWVGNSFNQLPLSVIEYWSTKDGSYLNEFILQPTVEDSFYDWICEKTDSDSIINEFLEDIDSDEINDIDSEIHSFNKIDETFELSFIGQFGQELWEDLKTWCIDSNEYQDEIQEYIDEQENYPMWSTLFEFKDRFRNNQEITDKCIGLGLGVIEGLDEFNNMIFMTSCGHSFYGSYWIPLYLELFSNEKEKFKDVNYLDL